MKLYGTSKHEIINALRFSAKTEKGESTAYGIAKACGYSARHINRVLSEMWYEGTVAYVDSLGRNGKPCRRWTLVSRAKTRKRDGWIINPDALRQMELPL